MDLMDYRRKIIANSPHLMSASGAVASFSDGEDLPLNSLNVDIEPVQSGSGDPSPSNVRPITGWNGVKVTRCGKNLWKRVSNSYPVSSYGITYSLNADGSIHVQGTASGQSNNYPIASNGMSVCAGTYTMSVKTTDPNIHFIFGGGNGTSGVAYTDMVNGSVKTFATAGGTTGHNIIRINSGATVNGDIYIQLEEGSTATQYEPYNGVDVSIDLGQTVYGGTLNPLTGVLTVDRAMVDLGMLTWNTSSSGTNRFYSSNNGTPIYDKNNGVGMICSQYKYDGFGYPATSYYGASGTLRLLGTANSQAREIYIVDDAKAGKTGAQFKADMSGVQLVYVLSTPYEIQLTPHQIRSLYGNNTIFADTGNVALEYWAHP